MDYAVGNLKRQKIALVYQNDDFGLEGRQGAVSALAAHGLKPIADIPLDIFVKDIKEQIENLTEAAPEVVIMWVNPTQAILLRQEAEAADLKVLWMTGSALAGRGGDGQTHRQVVGRDHLHPVSENCLIPRRP